MILVLLLIPASYAIAEPALEPSEATYSEPAEPTEPSDDVEVVAPPEPVTYGLPSEFTVKDNPNDGGRAILINWPVPCKDDKAGDPKCAKGSDYLKSMLLINRRPSGSDEFKMVAEVPIVQGKYVDSYAPPSKKKDKGDGANGGNILVDKQSYDYKFSVKQYPEAESVIYTATPKGQWFNTDYWSALFATLLYVFFVGFLIWKAKSGKKMYVRPISGINAVEEAVGRATEMGKPVLYIPGIGEIQEVATLAALTILSPIAEKIAEYNTPILVPNRDPVVYTVAQEVVREAYLKAGVPDAYNEDSIFFLSGRQFAYAAAVSGIMMRDKPGTNFFFGVFYAESLILAETGAATGAIQIAGTDRIAQLPFFIAACDYTLIGEELYAASAYLSDDPVLVGTLKALDWAKIVILGYIGAGTILGFFGLKFLADIL